jgi:hypothetical protein
VLGPIFVLHILMAGRERGRDIQCGYRLVVGGGNDGGA